MREGFIFCGVISMSRMTANNALLSDAFRLQLRRSHDAAKRER